MHYWSPSNLSMWTQVCNLWNSQPFHFRLSGRKKTKQKYYKQMEPRRTRTKEALSQWLPHQRTSCTDSIIGIKMNWTSCNSTKKNLNLKCPYNCSTRRITKLNYPAPIQMDFLFTCQVGTRWLLNPGLAMLWRWQMHPQCTAKHLKWRKYYCHFQ